MTIRRITMMAASLAAATTLSILVLAQSTRAEERLEGGTIIYVHEQEPPCLWGGWVQQAYLSRQVFDYLVSYDNGQIRPWLATDWSESKDRKTITFHLRKDVVFTDGDKFNADAVIANYPAWEKGIGWHGFTYMKGFTKVDDSTVELHLSDPNPEIYNVLANGHYGFQSPKSLANNSSEQKCLTPVGTGPWKIEKWTRGSGISFLRNDAYQWAPANAHHNGPAYAERLEWKFVPDATTRWGALISGQANVAYQPPSVQWKAAQQRFQTLDFVATGRPQGLSFNVARPPFADQRVRQAFTYAIDRKRIVAAVFKGAVPYEGNGSLSKTTPLYLNVDDGYTFDVDKANALLDQAGWSKRDAMGYRVKDGKVLEARLPFNQAIIDSEGAIALQAIQDQVKAVGFKVDLVPLTQTEGFAGAYSKPDQKEISFGYWVWPSPNILDIVYNHQLNGRPNGNNTSFFNDEAVEAKIIDAQREGDPALRKAKFDALQHWFSDQAVAIGVYNFTYNVAVDNRLKGLWQDQGNGLLNFNDAYFVKE
ncbi:ABC transporter substrate-binding protein [Rhizobium sp. S152]|uniref:ABC transporter substrate-binding protein n=1 Tax=Rhizobium sp. S152 TaxID=3055038 RepID=UPI0025AA0222|nr:ABC transporter substrate-binding protein [Rhizobium sp. S152]MDM9624711.1 ABC transporter substrate-binding protein [Rhizobium sp. S152]